jgi:hypothetical protein
MLKILSILSLYVAGQKKVIFKLNKYNFLTFNIVEDKNL